MYGIRAGFDVSEIYTALAKTNNIHFHVVLVDRLKVM